MPLVRARCRACTLPLGDPPHVALPVTCARCGVAASVTFAADGQPVDFDPAFAATRLLGWLGSARLAMTSGMLGVALGACPRCASPLLVSSHHPASLPCPHCGEAVAGPAASVLVDQWAEPWARVEGGGLQLEYRLALLEDRTGLSAGCAACGAPTPPEDPSTQCARCGAVTWVPRDASRVQLGVRVDGMRDGRPFKAVVPIVQGEAMLRADAARGTKGQSGSSLLGVTAIGCATAVAAIMALLLAIGIAAHFSHC
jgi:hypothetical protein